jgi:hypothetical protein
MKRALSDLEGREESSVAQISDFAFVDSCGIFNIFVRDDDPRLRPVRDR